MNGGGIDAHAGIAAKRLPAEFEQNPPVFGFQGRLHVGGELCSNRADKRQLTPEQKKT
jgi:hypothetical protein